MRCEVVAIGTELLLGQIVDTNSSWIGEQLATAGIDCLQQTKVGDNHDRMVAVLHAALDRADAVICCGGLGPTQDDVTREAIAEVMGVALERDDEVAERIEAMFGGRGRSMPANNLRQADVPVGAAVIPDQPGTAPGLICPVGDKVVYAVPGVPWEMKQMVASTVLPDLRARTGDTAVIRSRTLRTWGMSESGLDEALTERMAALDETGTATIAFLASGWEGLKVRLTAKAATAEAADQVLAREVALVHEVIGDVVFSDDDETMEAVVVDLCRHQGLTLGTAESLTGGLIASRLVDVPGASDVVRGGIVSYSSDVKHQLLDVAAGPVVSEETALAMAEGACGALGCDVSVAATGVAGPEPLEGQRPGTVWVATCVDGEPEAHLLRLPGGRDQVRQFSVISVLALLRHRLLAR